MTASRSRRRKHKGGYKVLSLFNRVFNLAMAAGILLLAAPVMLLLALIIRLGDGGPALYSGYRLGRNKRPFRMFKFRTLAVDAHARLGAEPFWERLTSNKEMLTRTGRFLRETRLDELPQFLNVIRGDMDLIGPRPVRPEIYERVHSGLHSYDRRFLVKPGVIGYSQMFTPPSTPSRIRQTIDNHFINIRHRYHWDVLLVLWAVAAAARRITQRTVRYLWEHLVEQRLLGRYREKRFLERYTLTDTRVTITPDAPGSLALGPFPVRDINEDAFSLLTGHTIPAGPLLLRMESRVRHRSGRLVCKTAHCRGELYYSAPQPSADGDRLFVLRFKPVSPFNRYIVHQYLMHGSFAEP